MFIRRIVTDLSDPRVRWQKRASELPKTGSENVCIASQTVKAEEPVEESSPLPSPGTSRCWFLWRQPETQQDFTYTQRKAVCGGFRQLERILQHRVDPTKEREELGGERFGLQEVTLEDFQRRHKRDLSKAKAHVL